MPAAFSTGRHWRRHGTREQEGRMPGVGGLVTLPSWESGGWRGSRAFPAGAGSAPSSGAVGIPYARYGGRRRHCSSSYGRRIPAPVIGQESIPRGRGDRPNLTAAKSNENPVNPMRIPLPGWGPPASATTRYLVRGGGRGGQPAGQRTSVMPSPSGSVRNGRGTDAGRRWTGRAGCWGRAGRNGGRVSMRQSNSNLDATEKVSRRYWAPSDFLWWRAMEGKELLVLRTIHKTILVQQRGQRMGAGRSAREWQFKAPLLSMKRECLRKVMRESKS
ncbi:hypothetical protein THAOC_02963 [Thalassiosira oceanica]|uniref:Uncharacterized protein n=1 Tax=Thalassiosira oceanica TaxID=159749 RepID=K0TLH9_THAOC|nr:hypothetical protein THAOC_02963 [Thalassiosira oceanica]|eukprot:EJK75316.1 hypothetical protein THAOC_02963 [Thalassiosira oceanica]